MRIHVLMVASCLVTGLAWAETPQTGRIERALRGVDRSTQRASKGLVRAVKRRMVDPVKLTEVTRGRVGTLYSGSGQALLLDGSTVANTVIKGKRWTRFMASNALKLPRVGAISNDGKRGWAVMETIKNDKRTRELIFLRQRDDTTVAFRYHNSKGSKRGEFKFPQPVKLAQLLTQRLTSTELITNGELVRLFSVKLGDRVDNFVSDYKDLMRIASEGRLSPEGATKTVEVAPRFSRDTRALMQRLWREAEQRAGTTP